MMYDKYIGRWIIKKKDFYFFIMKIREDIADNEDAYIMKGYMMFPNFNSKYISSNTGGTSGTFVGTDAPEYFVKKNIFEDKLLTDIVTIRKLNHSFIREIYLRG